MPASLFDRQILVPFSKLTIAYSGGLDSHCLLHALANDAEYKSKLTAVHINHDLSANANAWQVHCAKICAHLNIPFRAIKVKLEDVAGESLESLARDARYRALAHFVDRNTALLTAQHQDDQAETLLLQLFRGAGIKGLAAMPKIKAFSAGWLVRPLLQTNRQTLQCYAKQQQLQWVEDESNYQQYFNRNYLRHTIMPLLKQRWPEVEKTIARSSAHCAIATTLLDDLSLADLHNCSDPAHMLSLRRLNKLPLNRQVNVLREWLHQQSGYYPSSKLIKCLFKEVILARKDAQPQVAVGTGTVRRFKTALYFVVQNTDIDDNEYSWDWQQTALRGAGFCLYACNTWGAGLDTRKLPKRLIVRFRRGGEKIKPQGFSKTRRLKNLLQEWQVPMWQRQAIPLIYVQEQLVAVTGYCYHEDYTAMATQSGIIVRAA